MSQPQLLPFPPQFASVAEAYSWKRLAAIAAATCWLCGAALHAADGAAPAPAEVERKAEPFPPAATDEALTKKLESLLEGPEYKHARFAAYVVRLDKSRRVLVERRADEFFAPASVTKTFSCAAALVDLGGDMRFETPVYATSPWTKEGDLPGDLIVRASGDPTLGGRTDAAGRVAFTNSDHTYAGFLGKAELTDPDPLAGLDQLAEQVFKAGVRRVHGEVQVDPRIFAAFPSSGSGPGKVHSWTINDNLLDFTIQPRQAGEFARVVMRPENGYFSVDAQILTIPSGLPPRLTMHAAPDRGVVLRGQIPEDAAPLVATYEIPDPPAFGRALFIERLRKAGVQLEASPLRPLGMERLPAVEAYARFPVVAKLTSPPLREHLRLVLKVSHNLHASLLPMLLAIKRGEGERSLDAGLARQRTVLAGLGLDTEGISFGGGAGGSPADQATARATVELLSAMHGRDDFADFLGALPELGRDGTLAKVLDPGSPSRGKVRAKTGTLVWFDGLNRRPLCLSKALAGYVDRPDGSKWAFAFFLGGVPMADNSGVDRLGKLLAHMAETLEQSPDAAAE